MKNVKIIFCDNTGENKTHEGNCMKKLEEIKFDLTLPDTPQKNAVVEQESATLYSRMRE